MQKLNSTNIRDARSQFLRDAACITSIQHADSEKMALCQLTACGCISVRRDMKTRQNSRKSWPCAKCMGSGYKGQNCRYLKTDLWKWRMPVHCTPLHSCFFTEWWVYNFEINESDIFLVSNVKTAQEHNRRKKDMSFLQFKQAITNYIITLEKLQFRNPAALTTIFALRKREKKDCH